MAGSGGLTGAGRPTAMADASGWRGSGKWLRVRTISPRSRGLAVVGRPGSCGCRRV